MNPDREPGEEGRNAALNAPWSFSPMKGRPGHCSMAQVWDAEGNSLAQIETACGADAANVRAAMIAVAPDLYEALKAVHALIIEAAGTGFNWKDGDWAERLFASQWSTSQALKCAALASPTLNDDAKEK